MNYRVTFIPRLDSDDVCFKKEYGTAEEAETALGAIALYTLMLHDCLLMPDYSNIGAVERKAPNGEWIEIDGDGHDV